MSETTTTFACFGSHCSLYVSGDADSAREAVAAARARLLEWHERFTRFAPDSELSRLNAAPEPAVAVSADMAQFAQAVRDAAERTGGLVDATLLTELEVAGYDTDLGRSLPLELALRLVRTRRPAQASPVARWREVEADVEARVVRRPPGVGLDSGGLAKGLFADLLAADLAAYPSFAND
jgi:thiamine biosynthesis lipoprotein